ncbi:MAG: hypothetical protein ACP5N1_00660, partial [Candidatus Woesearchaeota archaeon]
GTKSEHTENTLLNVNVHMNWNKRFADRVISKCSREEWLSQKHDGLFLTDKGRKTAEDVMIKI